MEDVCCTAPLDKNHLKEGTSPPCAFTLSPEVICPTRPQ